jgi:hypothetical protein
MRLQLGCAVGCVDGDAGVLADLVIDPGARRVTHLVVEPRHRHALARLVPIALARESGAGLALSCRSSELHRMPEVHEFAFGRLYAFPVLDPGWTVGVQDALATPDPDYPGLAWNPGDGEPRVSVVFDRIPGGEVELRRGSSVTTADGWPLGTVAGATAADDDRLTHILVRRHRLGRSGDTVLPIGAVERLDTDAVVLRLTKRELRG